MKRVTSILLLLVSFSFFAQESPSVFSVKGMIIDAETNLPLPYATVTFHSEKENIFSGGVTNNQGEFDVNVSSGTYRVSFNFFSFKTKIIDSLSINRDLDFGNIYLNSDVENLKEVEVKVNEKLIEYKFNKKIYNASKDISNVGGNAITVLENTPSVMVNEEGKFSIRGAAVLVLVNGRPYGGQENDAEVLSLIPSNSIAKVEIITQSAKYDAQGGGIINIILKKGKFLGYNGTIEGHTGLPDNDGGSTFINYKSDKINVFTTASFNHLDRIKKSNINQNYFDSENKAKGHLEESRKDDRQRNSALFSIGSDFYLDKSNTITTSVLYAVTNKNFFSNLNFNDFDTSDDPVQITERDVWDNTDESRFEALLNYVRTFKTKDHKLSFDIQYSKRNSDNLTDINSEISIMPAELTQQQSVKYQDLDNYLSQIDYQHPIVENGLLEVGLKANFRKYYNDFTAKVSDDTQGQFVVLDGYQNEIAYREDVLAAYVNFNKEIDKFNFSVGIRTESTKTNIKEESTGTDNKEDYTNFFPTASLGYSFKDESILTLFYKRYIDRPQVHQLNPFVSFSNNRLMLTGNPYLKPYYSNRFILEYYKDFGKFNITSALFYTGEKDQISSVLINSGEQTADGFDVFVKKPINNGDLDQYGLDFEIMYLPTKFIRLNAYINPYFFDLKNTIDNKYDYDDFVFYGRFMSELKFSESFKFQLYYHYLSPKKTALTSVGSIQYLNIAFSKIFWDNKATLTFKVNDLFNLREYNYTSYEANTFTKSDWIFDSQYLLSFTYRFNKAKRRDSHNRTKDIENDVFEKEPELDE